MEKKIYIIGAGIAGLSAAFHLSKAGYKNIEIFESSPYAGGRCRSYFDEYLGCEIDNGNHLILQANSHVFELIDSLGTRNKFNEFSEPVFNFYNNKTGEKYNFTPPLPTLKRYGISEFSRLFKFLLFKNNKTVFESFKYAPKLFEEVINPISRSILNTASEAASASILRNVFLRIMKFGKSGFNYYYPKNSWGDALIEPLTKYLQNSGVKINFSQGIKGFEFENDKVTKICFSKDKIDLGDAQVIMAAPAHSAAKMLNITAPEKFEAIYNIHFKFLHNLKPQIYGVINAPAEWFFVKDGIISTTFSAASSFDNSDDDIAAKTWEIFCKIFNVKDELPPHRIIKEKRASFVCEKHELAKRPATNTQWSNLFLCGDYVENALPATLEGAALNGKNAANIFQFSIIRENLA